MRLIDLHTDWLLQYATTTTIFEPAYYTRVLERLGQVDGYLHGTWAAVLSVYRKADDWSKQHDPWGSLGTLVTRLEAEFCGRLLTGPADLHRWLDDPDSLCWGLIGIEGFDALVRSRDDLEPLRRLFDRGVRLFQPLYTADNALGGSATPGDDRGLSELGFAFLETLSELGTGAARPLFDLAHLNPRSAGDALGWFEADSDRSRRVIPVYSHGALSHDGFTAPRALTRDNLARLRALGGSVGLSVGPPFYTTAGQLKADIEAVAAVPYQGRTGFEGIAIGTDFLGIDTTLAGLSRAEEVVSWLVANFEPAVAAALVQGNGRALFERILGAADIRAGSAD